MCITTVTVLQIDNISTWLEKYRAKQFISSMLRNAE